MYLSCFDHHLCPLVCPPPLGEGGRLDLAGKKLMSNEIRIRLLYWLHRFCFIGILVILVLLVTWNLGVKRFAINSIRLGPLYWFPEELELVELAPKKDDLELDLSLSSWKRLRMMKGHLD